MRFDIASRFAISFMPRGDTDSGGSLWWRFYSRIEDGLIGNFPIEEVRFAEETTPSWHGEIQIFDDKWLHLVDGSGWGDGQSKVDKLPLRSFNLEAVLAFVENLPGRGSQ